MLPHNYTPKLICCVGYCRHTTVTTRNLRTLHIVPGVSQRRGRYCVCVCVCVCLSVLSWLTMCRARAKGKAKREKMKSQPPLLVLLETKSFVPSKVWMYFLDVEVSC